MVVVKEEEHLSLFAHVECEWRRKKRKVKEGRREGRSLSASSEEDRLNPNKRCSHLVNMEFRTPFRSS